MKKIVLASVIGMMTTGTYAMQNLSDHEMSQVEGQALLNFSKDNYIYTTAKNEKVNFYKLGLDVEMELNTNIKSLQLGCGGVNNSIRQGCDIDIQNLSLSGLPDNYNAAVGITADSIYTNGRAASSAKITNPFIEFAIKNGDQASTREIVGFRLGAEEILGLLSVGTDNIVDPNDGIRSFSGYMKMGATSGDVNTQASKFGVTEAQEIEGVLTALGKTRVFRSNHENENNTGITVPSINVTFNMPETIVKGQRLTAATVTGISAHIPVIPLAAGSGIAGVDDALFKDDQLYVEFEALLGSLGDHSKFKMKAGSKISDLNLNISFTQALSMIHNIPLTGTGGYLSLQRETVKWAGTEAEDIAQVGWWMSIKDPVNLGYLKAADQVDISSVLPEVADLVTGFMMGSEKEVIEVGTIEAVLTVLGTPVERMLNIDLSSATQINPAVINLNSQVLQNQSLIPNCFGNYKFC